MRKKKTVFRMDWADEFSLFRMKGTAEAGRNIAKALLNVADVCDKYARNGATDTEARERILNILVEIMLSNNAYGRLKVLSGEDIIFYRMGKTGAPKQETP